MLATIGTLGAAAVAPATAGAVTATVTGDDGNPVALGGAINLRNMSPKVAVTPGAGEHYGFTVSGPNGGQVAVPDSCVGTSDTPRTVDYVSNGLYTVNLTKYSDVNCTNATGTTGVSFTITAAVALGTPQNAVLTRKAGSIIPNTVNVPIDLNPGALTHEVFAGRNVQPNPDGSLPGTPTQLFPDSVTRTVSVRLGDGPGNYVVVARAKGFSGLNTPNAFTAWSAPVTIKTFDPFDLERFTWTDQRGPSYRLTAKVRSAGVSGRVSVAIGKGTKGKYKSYGTVKLSSKHTFSKRFRLSGTGKYRIRFKYKGNANVAGGFEVRKFQIRKTFRFSSASIAG